MAGDVNAECAPAAGTFPCRGAPGFFCDVGTACIVQTREIFDEISEQPLRLTIAGCSFDDPPSCDSDAAAGLCTPAPSNCSSDADGNVTVVCE